MPKMMKSLMGRIHGCPQGADPFVFNCVRTALAPLDKIERGLCRQAASYVCTGEGSAVLLALQNQAGKSGI